MLQVEWVESALQALFIQLYESPFLRVYVKCWYVFTCSASSGNYYSLWKRMMPSLRKSPRGNGSYFMTGFECVCAVRLTLLLPTGVRNSSSTTCGCKIFPATGRDSSPSSANFSPTNPRGRTTTTWLSTDPARRSYKRERQGGKQGSCSEGKLYIMNVITAPQHTMCSPAASSFQELHVAT